MYSEYATSRNQPRVFWNHVQSLLEKMQTDYYKEQIYLIKKNIQFGTKANPIVS